MTSLNPVVTQLILRSQQYYHGSADERIPTVLREGFGGST